MPLDLYPLKPATEDTGGDWDARGIDDRDALLSLAETRLMQAAECRHGYLADAFIADATRLLRRAGREDWAARLDEDWLGDEAGDVLAEVTGARAIL